MATLNYSSSSEEEEVDEESTPLEDFVLKTLARFSASNKKSKEDISEQLQKIENKQEEIIRNQKELQKQVDELKTEVTTLTAKHKEVEKGKLIEEKGGLKIRGPIPLCKKQKVTPNPKPKFKPPVEINDLSEEWREILRPSIGKVTPTKPDKLTVPQIAFFNHWISNKSNLTASVSNIMELIADGCRAGLWRKEWSPSEGKTLSEYLMNRVKGELTKRRRARQTERLENRFLSFEQASFDDLLNYID